MNDRDIAGSRSSPEPRPSAPPLELDRAHSPDQGHRHRRSGLALVVTLGLLMSMAAWPGAGPAAAAGPVAESRPTGRSSTPRPTTTPAGTADDPRIRIEAQDFAVAPDGDFRVLLEVANAPGGSDVAVQIYDRITDPDELAASTTTEPAGILATFDLIPLVTKAVDSQAALFAISLYGPNGDRPAGVAPGWVYQLDEAGVYPIRIRVRGPDRSDLVTVVTYLVREPDPLPGDATTPGPVTPDGSEDEPRPVTPVEVALVADITADPPADSRIDAALDPAYQEALDRFLRTVADHPEVPLDVAATPDVTDRLNADPDAIDTLEALRTQLRRTDTELLGAPYVAIDPASLASTDLDDELIRQRDYGARALQRSLGPFEPGGGPVADTWMIERPLDLRSTSALARIGVTRLVVPAATVDGELPRGPFRLATDPGSPPVEAVATVADVNGRSAPEDPVLGAHQLLGRIAAQGTIDGGGAAAIQLDPQSLDVTMLTALLAVLAQPGSSLHAATISGAFTASASPEATAALAAPRVGDLGRYPALVARTNQRLSAYASMIPGRPDLLETFERPLARSASPALSLTERTTLVTDTRRRLDRRLGAISTPPTDRVTLGTRDARFPLPITSDLDEATDVVITLEARDRLSLPRTTIPVTVDPGHSVVPIPVSARATGDTPLTITVLTPDGSEVLSTSRYTVRSTAVSGVGVVLTIGAGGFLALWWGRHWWRTRQRGRHARPPGGAAPDPGDEVFVADGPSPSA